MFALMETGNREVIKAAIGFIKVAAVRLPQTDLAAQLPTLVPALLHCCDDEDGFNRFRSKVRVVMERMVKRCGWDAVEAVTPELHSALVQHMRREEVRTERRRKASVAGSEFGGGAKSLAGKSARTARKSAWNDQEVFSDDDGQTMRTGRGGRSTVGGGGGRGAQLDGADVEKGRGRRRAEERGGGSRASCRRRREAAWSRFRLRALEPSRRERDAPAHAQPAPGRRTRRRRPRRVQARRGRSPGHRRGEGGTKTRSRR